MNFTLGFSFCLFFAFHFLPRSKNSRFPVCMLRTTCVSATFSPNLIYGTHRCSRPFQPCRLSCMSNNSVLTKMVMTRIKKNLHWAQSLVELLQSQQPVSIILIPDNAVMFRGRRHRVSWVWPVGIAQGLAQTLSEYLLSECHWNESWRREREEVSLKSYFQDVMRIQLVVDEIALGNMQTALN